MVTHVSRKGRKRAKSAVFAAPLLSLREIISAFVSRKERKGAKSAVFAAPFLSLRGINIWLLMFHAKDAKELRAQCSPPRCYRCVK
jgi:hypothetical protein